MSLLERRLPTHTVSVKRVERSVDVFGDGTTTSTTVVADRVSFAPEGIAEQSGGDAVAVVGDATLYGPLPQANADDLVTHDPECCDGADFGHGTWQVVGGSRGWGRGDKAIPIRRTGAA